MEFGKRTLSGISELITELKQMIINGVTPSKTVSWFYRDTPPTGWVICNGKWYSTDGKQSSNTETDICTVSTPNLIGRYPLGSTSSIGVTVAAGLPNITGSVVICGKNESEEGEGCFRGAIVTNNVKTNASAGDTQIDTVTLKFDARESNALYGKSTTVTPPSVKLLPCMKL